MFESLMSPALGMERSEVEICLVNLYIFIYKGSETKNYPTRCFMQLVQSSGD